MSNPDFWPRVWSQLATFPASTSTTPPAPAPAPQAPQAHEATYCPVCLFTWQELHDGAGFLPDADAEFCAMHQERLMEAFPDATEAQKVLLRIELHGTQHR